jgi:hypothetical protein
MSEDKKVEEPKAEEVQTQRLTKEQQAKILLDVHTFLSNFDRIPGALAAQFAKVLDGIAIVNNNIALEADEAKKCCGGCEGKCSDEE